ncbi:hypothetical protein SAMN05660772_01879 [Pasteurella testudinis DSM 23072]|uniref:Uncharacterized protein n=1 Tax=Pasteurella testudinis DSM 23072 TaxID=1122938 RepID=A0A1W1UKF4_9PAST|nr:hypothetical protein [Pasteurella testudinis]SMB81519.1 hypothetical protein SAMN05660772_01879 [Pasteurella testudinis DSM 23072]SUB51438.1 Uncharacterised protein [Pasteurella testudinis]
MMTPRELLERHQELKAQRAELTRQDNELKAELVDIEGQLSAVLDETGTDSIAVRGVATAYKTEEVVPTVEDWETFNNFARDNDLLFLFQRRLNVAAYRELLEQGVEVMGLIPTQITKISVRKN